MRFIDTVANFLHVSREGNSLRLKPFQSAALELRHVGSGLFRVRDKLLASHVLLVSADGERIITSGTQSYKKVPLIYLLSLWASVLAGVLGLAYVIVAGIARISLRRLSWQDPLAAPIAGVLALLLPLPFFYRQSFIQLGDLTLASGLLAAVTAALPVTMCIGLAMAQGRKAWRSVETAAMLTVLQSCLVLADWRMLPLRLWA